MRHLSFNSYSSLLRPKLPKLTRMRHVTRLIGVLMATLVTHLAAGRAQAQSPWTAGCVESVDVGGGLTITEVATIRGFECLLANILATATTFIGLAAFVMLLVGAFLYMTSGSSTKGTEAAKQTFTYALIGIIVALMAFFILQLVASFTGINTFLQFNLNLK